MEGKSEPELVNLKIDWRESILDDKNFDQKKPYDVDKVIEYFEKLTLDLEHLNPYFFFFSIYEFTKAFNRFSSALSMGFADITEKVGTWRDLFKLHKEEDIVDIQSLMEREIQLGFHKLNGDNNSKLGFKKGTANYKYVSGCRTMVRLSWFLHFLYKTFKNMLDTADPFNSCIKKAYQEILAPHHPWLVKSSVSLVLNLAGAKREPAFEAFFCNSNYEEVKEKMISLTDKMYITWSYIHKWLDERKLLDLP